MCKRYLVPAIFGPWAPVLVKRAARHAGERVLNVACGAGIVARVAAQQVGITGKVVGLDTNAAMLAVARSLPRNAGASIEWQEGDALALPYADAAFDVILCQLGSQFFADRPRALCEMHQVLAPGGCVALLVWGPIEQSPGYARLSEALARHIGEAAASIMRAPFVLGDAEKVPALMAEAPFRDMDIRIRVGQVHFPLRDDFVRNQAAGSPPDGPVSQAGDNACSVLMSEVHTALRPYVQQDGLAFPIQARLMSAHTQIQSVQSKLQSNWRLLIMSHRFLLSVCTVALILFVSTCGATEHPGSVPLPATATISPAQGVGFDSRTLAFGWVAALPKGLLFATIISITQMLALCSLGQTNVIQAP